MAEVVVITGASAGVGRATALEFAERGCTIGLLARGETGLDATRKEVEAHGGHALAIPVDVADADAVEDAASRVEDEFGAIDVWVNDAMTTVFSPLLSMTADEFRRVTEVTYLGFVYGTMAALRRMVARDRGTVVQVGSALAFQGIPLQSAYCGAKHAMHGFTESVRAELVHQRSKVRIVEVHLPGVNTPQFSWCRSHMSRHPQPVPPIYEPEMPARAIVQAVDERRQQVLLGVPTVQTVLGNRFIPWLMPMLTSKRAWNQQMTEQPTEERAGNLFEPFDCDAGAHGPFDGRAKSGVVQSWPRARAGVRAFTMSAIAATLGFEVKIVDEV